MKIPTKQQIKKYSLRSIPVALFIAGYIITLFITPIFLEKTRPWWILMFPTIAYSIALSPVMSFYLKGSHRDGFNRGYQEGYSVMEESYNSLVKQVNAANNMSSTSLFPPVMIQSNKKILKSYIKELRQAAEETEQKQGGELLKRFLDR